MLSRVNIVLVHGAFCDGSIWVEVIPFLQKVGHHIVAVQLPLTRLLDDVATTKKTLASLSNHWNCCVSSSLPLLPLWYDERKHGDRGGNDGIK